MAKAYLTLFAITLLVSGTAQGQNTDDIIRYYFETVSNGDLDDWHKIKSVYIEGVSFYNEQASAEPSMLNHMESIRPSYQKLYREWPDKLRIELYSDSTYNQFLSSNLWLHDKLITQFGNMEPIMKPLEMPNSWDFDPVYLSKLLDRSKSIEYKGTKHFEIDGIVCFDILVKTKELTVDYYFNRETYLLEYYKILNKSDSTNYVKLFDYKEINGLLFNMATYAMSNGRILHSYTISRIEINRPIEPGKFK